MYTEAVKEKQTATMKYIGLKIIQHDGFQLDANFLVGTED